MKHKITHLLAALILTFSMAGTLVVASPTTVAAAGDKCTQHLLTFPAWYRGLLNDNCEIDRPGQGDNDLSNFIWKIVLNVIDMLMQLIGYASVVFLVIGGFKYMTSTGDSSKMTDAKNTVTNAIIGLVIALASVAIVNVVAGII